MKISSELHEKERTVSKFIISFKQFLEDIKVELGKVAPTF